ncbi:MAG: aminotransferase class I/II-fold pyridoxal phosphate-dependent enzyme [Deltaproteobacteria bacterium]|nr:aminotransferase class I/II-fold pyridoxal phosphate-dependent enzyme [Deltaproteobacteria bacterium]
MQSFDPEQMLVNDRREFGEHGGVTPSISRSSTFTVMDAETMPEIFKGVRTPEKGGCFLYSRHFNPTVDVLSRYLASMEGSKSAICTASGMAAISCTIMQLCRSGDHIVASDTIYGGSHALLADLLPQLNIRTTFVDITDHGAVEAAFTKNTKVLYTEAVGNPTLKVADIPFLSTLAHRNDASLVVDNTFSPMIISPLMLGADVVVYSLTKFINGASDVIAGAVCASREFVLELMDLHTGRLMLLGPTMDPRVAFDVIQRLPHLPVRMREHSRRAMAMAECLHEKGKTVTYPGLPSFAQHDLAEQLFNEGYGFGGMLTLDCTTRKKADRLMDILQNEEKFGYIAVSLGYFDTLMSCSSATTSSEISAEEQARMGLSQGLLRISAGITGSLEDRLDQLKRGVDKAGI